MEHRVFGDPITEETLRGMDEYKNKTTITRTDIANAALIMNNVAEAQAFEYIEKLKKEMPAKNPGVSTFGKIRNFTGDTIKYSFHHDFSGAEKSGYENVKYIKNGQHGVFTHKETSGRNSGSCGAVVYWVANDNGKECDLMFSWSNPTNMDARVFTEIAERGHYDGNYNWGDVHEELINAVAPSKYESGGFVTYMTTNPGEKNGVDVDAKVTISTA